MQQKNVRTDDAADCAASRRAFLGGAAATCLLPALPAAAAAPAPVALRAEAGLKQLLPAPAPETSILGFGGVAPGPIIRVKRGEPFRATFENRTGENSSLHWYGLHGANGVDGVVGLTQGAVPPGGLFEVAFTPMEAGTLWFQPLSLGTAASQLDRGLSGGLIVEETAPPPVDAEVIILLDDWRLGEDGQPLGPFNDPLDAARSGRLGGLLTVNGRAGAEEIRLPPRSRVRVRLVNVSNARIMPMRFEGAGAAAVIGLDGQPTDPFDPLRKQVVLGPGGRFDVLVDLPAEEGRICRVLAALGPGVPLLMLTAEGASAPARLKATALESNGLPPAVTLQNAERTTFEITGGLPAPPGAVPWEAAAIRARFPDANRIWRVNGGRNAGFSGPPLARVRSGRPMVIAVANKSAWTQVIHTHGHHFRLSSSVRRRLGALLARHARGRAGADHPDRVQCGRARQMGGPVLHSRALRKRGRELVRGNMTTRPCSRARHDPSRRLGFERLGSSLHA